MESEMFEEALRQYVTEHPCAKEAVLRDAHRREVEAVRTTIMFALREMKIGAGMHKVQFVAWLDGKSYAVQQEKIEGIFRALELHCREVAPSAFKAVSYYENRNSELEAAREAGRRDGLLEAAKMLPQELIELAEEFERRWREA